MNISIASLNKNHMKAVIDILQSISNYKPDQKEYLQIWNDFQSQSNNYALVGLDENLDVVGYGSLFIKRTIRGGKMGQIEDIVVHKNLREKGIGTLILNSLYQIAKEEKCYKVSLMCKEHNVSFYEKCDFLIEGISLSRF